MRGDARLADGTYPCALTGDDRDPIEGVRRGTHQFLLMRGCPVSLALDADYRKYRSIRTARKFSRGFFKDLQKSER